MEMKRLYTCEIYHTDYAEKEKAVACEKGHKKATAYQGHYKPIAMTWPYPYAITVTFEDGKQIRYRQ